MNNDTFILKRKSDTRCSILDNGDWKCYVVDNPSDSYTIEVANQDSFSLERYDEFCDKETQEIDCELSDLVGWVDSIVEGDRRWEIGMISGAELGHVFELIKNKFQNQKVSIKKDKEGFEIKWTSLKDEDER